MSSVHQPPASLPDDAYRDIVKFAKLHDLQQVVLFGSRARGDHQQRSDIDLAISGGNAHDYKYDLNQHGDSLRFFDVVDLDHTPSLPLRQEISREGILIYEKI